MAWNGSTNVGGTTPASKKPAKKSPGLTHGLIAGAAIVLIGIVALYFVSGDKEEQSSDKKVSTKIAEVEPEIATQDVVSVVKEDAPKKKSKYIDYDPDKVYRDERGVLRYKKGDGRVPHSDEEMEKYVIHHTVYDTGLPQFKHNCEMEIAVLLTLEPGQMIFGDIERNRMWKEEFMRSIVDPTEVTKDDTDEDKEIKKAVEATKKDLVERMKAGEDIGEILDDARSEMRRLATYKDELLAIAREAAEGVETIDEVNTHLEAVNKMLEDKGLAPVKDTAIVKYKILREIKQAAEMEEKSNNKE